MLTIVFIAALLFWLLYAVFWTIAYIRVYEGPDWLWYPVITSKILAWVSTLIFIVAFAQRI